MMKGALETNLKKHPFLACHPVHTFVGTLVHGQRSLRHVAIGQIWEQLCEFRIENTS